MVKFHVNAFQRIQRDALRGLSNRADTDGVSRANRKFVGVANAQSITNFCACFAE